MNRLKNLRHMLSPILRCNSAVRPKPPPPLKPSTRCNHTSSRRPEGMQPSRELFRPTIRGRANRVVNRPPVAALPWHYSSWGSYIRNPLRGGQKWYQNQRIVSAVIATTCGVAITLFFGTFETVPYSNRTHFVVVTPNWERKLAENVFNKMKKKLDKNILPPNHPDSVRVKSLVTEIVGAAHRGLAHRENLYAGDDAWCGDIPTGHDTEADDTAPRGKGVLDNKSVSVPESRNRWKAKGAPLQTKHLDGLNWEVIVVKEKGVNAMCLPGGKIIVYTGLLDNLKTDAEVATVLGHEVGHVIARHAAEKITKNIWILILQVFIQIFCDAAKDMDNISSLLLQLPFSRRMELEADHIGILLLGAAGFDPHIAPSVYEKLGKINGDLGIFDFISTHPSSKKRARLLSEHMVMHEAMELYTEASAGKETKGFF